MKKMELNSKTLTMKSQINLSVLSPNSISYKDNSARVSKEGDTYYRYISMSYKSEYDHFIKSGLYQKLVQLGVLIEHKEVDFELKIETKEKENQKQVYKKLLPTQITFQSYPFEWSYGQWRKAIYSYLKINEIALKYGMILKDASPYNFYFNEGKAILLDTSSFMFYNDGDQWIAYRQFCSEFLSPLALMHYNGEKWSRISITHLRGFPLDFISKQLPLKSWFNLSCLLHIHFHSKFSNEAGSTLKFAERSITGKGFSKEKILSLIRSLISTVKKWKKPYLYEDHWANYYKEDIDSSAYLKHKEEIISHWLENIKPTSVLDLGSNTGHFSLLASKYTNQVISIEDADTCVDTIDHLAKNNGIKNIVALKNNLAEPTPNLGALTDEFGSIYKRAKSQMVLCLALVHHLCIKNKLSFDQITSMLSELSEKHIIIEFIPSSDNKVKLLNSTRVFDLSNYSEKEFKKSIQLQFKIEETIQLNGTDRKLFLGKKK
jgi:hypothetical protein